ncbi:hypothetical protein DITRI_Ditri19aG0056200 [Diplodiscus trichospermus]
MIKIALLCAHVLPASRPTVSEVVSMLEGSAVIPDVIPEKSSYNKDLQCNTTRNYDKQICNQTFKGSQAIRPFFKGCPGSAMAKLRLPLNMISRKVTWSPI